VLDESMLDPSLRMPSDRVFTSLPLLSRTGSRYHREEVGSQVGSRQDSLAKPFNLREFSTEEGNALTMLHVSS
jgi:hypothetical protein